MLHIKNIRLLHLIYAIALIGYGASSHGMVFDNRYFPLLQYPYITVPDRDSYATGDFFITTASQASDGRQRSVGIAELAGSFDQAQLAYSFQLAGLVNPLPPDLTDAQLKWNLAGKIQTQGFAFSYQQELFPCFSAGLLTMAMRSNSYIDFYFNRPATSALSDDDILTLDDIRRQMLATLGLSCNHVHQGGMGDTEVYLRWADMYEYLFKLRTLRYALRCGALIPTGVKKNIYQPASVPFGGNGYWGIYGSLDAEFELREDWKVGFLLRGSQRFTRTSDQRMPVLHPVVASQETNVSEPDIFGVIVGPARVSPGFTQIFYMYGEWEGIREGLGVRLQYTLVNHFKDSWKDERTNQTVPANIQQLQNTSGWASEYVTLSAFYDFDKANTERGCQPIVRASWDIPFTLLVAHNFVYSYKISLGLEFNF